MTSPDFLNCVERVKWASHQGLQKPVEIREQMVTRAWEGAHRDLGKVPEFQFP